MLTAFGLADVMTVVMNRAHFRQFSATTTATSGENHRTQLKRRKGGKPFGWRQDGLFHHQRGFLIEFHLCTICSIFSISQYSQQAKYAQPNPISNSIPINHQILIQFLFSLYFDFFPLFNFRYLQLHHPHSIPCHRINNGRRKCNQINGDACNGSININSYIQTKTAAIHRSEK